MYQPAGEVYISPPEMLNTGGYNLTDVNNWQLGCVLFELLTGYKPFDANDKDTRLTVAIIKNEPPNFSKAENLSKEAK